MGGGGEGAVAEGPVEGLGVEGGAEGELARALAPCDALEGADEAGADAPARRFREDVAGDQLAAGRGDRADADRLAAGLCDQADFAAGIGSEGGEGGGVYLGRPVVDQLGRIGVGGEAAHGGSVDLKEALGVERGRGSDAQPRLERPRHGGEDKREAVERKGGDSHSDCPLRTLFSGRRRRYATAKAMSAPQTFHYRGIETEAEAGLVRLRYGFDGGPDFTEEVEFGAPLPAPSAPGHAPFRAALEALHVLAGISYYKLYVPPRLELGGLAFDAQQIAFFEETFREGLGEFAYRNAIDLDGRIGFTGQSAPAAGRVASTRREQAADFPCAVLMGGGKDSLVSVEVLRAAAIPFVLFTVNPRPPMTDCAAAGELPLVAVRRRLDPRLFELNGAPGTYNGHVPITAIVSLIALCGAFVHGFGNVVLSNERSADEPTLTEGGRAVNHQYSKSSHFERRLADYVRHYISPEIGYFSLMRPLSEFHIARLFAKADRYDRAFTSCNAAFRITGPDEARWCGDCAKCRFTFLMLADAMAPERLCAIFGANLLDRPAQQAGFEALLGLDTHKPWDCVGEMRESRLAMVRLAGDPRWAGAAVVSALAGRLGADGFDAGAALDELLTPRWNPIIPPRFADALNAYLG